ncbi:MAG: CooT family nickel-binding protein [Desulfobulbaceae bacterium]|nr:CooT family nickel-binding protein [Desulfobulbaceae bacterium]
MCQISAVVEREGKQETIMEAVTGLEVTEKGVILTTFFEEPKVVPDVVIRRIDFLGGAVVLEASNVDK